MFIPGSVALVIEEEEETVLLSQSGPEVRLGEPGLVIQVIGRVISGRGHVPFVSLSRHLLGGKGGGGLSGDSETGRSYLGEPGSWKLDFCE